MGGGFPNKRGRGHRVLNANTTNRYRLAPFVCLGNIWRVNFPNESTALAIPAQQNPDNRDRAPLIEPHCIGYLM